MSQRFSIFDVIIPKTCQPVSESSVREYMAAYQHGGYVPPITIHADGGLVDGLARLEAQRRLGRTSVMVEIVPDVRDLQESQPRKETDPVELRKCLLISLQTHRLEEVAKLLGVTPNWIIKRL